MHEFLTKRLVIAWVAMLSVLFGALAPTVSQAMAASADAPRIEEVQVCTMGGMKTIVIADEGSGKPPAPSLDHMSKHCACCVTHGSPFLPPTADVALPFLPRSSALPPLFYQSPAPLFSWTTPSPRGPPAST